MEMQVAALDILATNQKLDETRVALNSKLDSLRVELNSKIDSVRVELNSKIDGFRTELKADIAALEVKLDGARLKLEGAFAVHNQEVKLQISEAKAQFWHWMIWLMMGQTAAVAGLLRLFMPHGP
jgi:hypothetical protein